MKKEKKSGLKITLGELVDRLSIINVKMWHVDQGISEAEKAGDMDKAGKFACMARNLNRERGDVREEINMLFHGYETGSNKIEYAGIGR